jgi:hypothetical protein
MGVWAVRHHNVADLPRIGARLHGINAVGEIGRPYPSTVGVDLVQGGISEIIVGAVDAAEMERHKSLSLVTVCYCPLLQLH